MARTADCGDVWPCPGLSLRSEPRQAEMAMAHMGQRICCDRMARCFHPVFLVRRQLRQLQQDLWFTGGGDRLHDLDMAVHHRRSSWGGIERGDRASIRAGYDDGHSKADGLSRCRNGGHRWSDDLKRASPSAPPDQPRAFMDA